MEREIILTVTSKDCRWDYYRGSGAGGQHRNKVDSAVRCTHIKSGAVGTSQDTRSQHQNKVLAFGRMARSKTFQDWIKVETAKLTGTQISIDEAVNDALKREKLIIEGIACGKWVPLTGEE